MHLLSKECVLIKLLANWLPVHFKVISLLTFLLSRRSQIILVLQKTFNLLVMARQPLRKIIQRFIVSKIFFIIYRSLIVCCVNFIDDVCKVILTCTWSFTNLECYEKDNYPLKILLMSWTLLTSFLLISSELILFKTYKSSSSFWASLPSLINSFFSMHVVPYSDLLIICQLRWAFLRTWTY